MVKALAAEGTTRQQLIDDIEDRKVDARAARPGLITSEPMRDPTTTLDPPSLTYTSYVCSHRVSTPPT